MDRTFKLFNAAIRNIIHTLSRLTTTEKVVYLGTSLFLCPPATSLAFLVRSNFTSKMTWYGISFDPTGIHSPSSIRWNATNTFLSSFWMLWFHRELPFSLSIFYPKLILLLSKAMGYLFTYSRPPFQRMGYPPYKKRMMGYLILVSIFCIFKRVGLFHVFQGYPWGSTILPQYIYIITSRGDSPLSSSLGGHIPAFWFLHAIICIIILHQSFVFFYFCSILI